MTKSAPAQPRRTRWKLADLLDYELLLQKYAETDAIETDLRDEVLGRAQVEGMSTRRADISVNRRWWLLEYTRAWQRKLQTKAEASGEEFSPGQIAYRTANATGHVLMVLTALAGFSVLGALFAQPARLPDGSPLPVNAFWVLGICLLPQVVLTLLALAGILARLAGFKFRPGVISRILIELTAVIGRRLLRLFSAHASTDFQARAKSALGLIFSRGRLHRQSLAWMGIGILQGGALIYSLALVLGMVALPQFKHITFGWQTSNAAVTPQRIHSVVTALSIPWRSLTHVDGVVAPKGPTLEEVADSQIDVNQGAANLDPMALTSWWPFLVACLLWYGILPRFLLLSLTSIAYLRALARERFTDSRSELLLGEIARWGELSAAPGPVHEGPANRAAADIAPPEAGAFPCLVVLPPELDRPEIRAGLEAVLAERLGWRILEFRAVYTVPEQEALLARLGEIDWSGAAPRVLFVQRWNAAIVQDTKALVRSIMAAIGKDGHVIFALGGKVRLLEEPVTREQSQYWREYANELKLGFPNVEVLPLAPSGDAYQPILGSESKSPGNGGTPSPASGA